MDTQQIRSAITADPALTALLPDSQAIATALSEGRTRPNQRELGNGTIIETIGLAAGNALLDTLLSTDAASPYRHIRPLLEQGRLIISSPLVVGTLQAMVGQALPGGVVFTQQHAEALIALGRTEDPVSELSVRRAIWNDDGTRAI